MLKFLKKLSVEERQLANSIKNITGFYPGNIFLYKMAFRHRSVASELSGGIKDSNERLEYLGDAILGAVIADYLFKKFPYKDEGFLTQLRSKIVSRENLNKLSEKMGVGKLLLIDKDSINNKSSVSGNAFEAFIGAIYLDKGYNFTKKIILKRIIKYHVDVDELESTELNFKSRLIEWAQKERKTVEFALEKEEGKGRNKLFHVNVLIDKETKGKGVDFSKKKAEQYAAEDALKKLIG
ncbi:MAG: ribonuclease III [Bacteroidales bacterium]|nr:ribonuclease III [Bacteroidales bacterium]